MQRQQQDRRPGRPQPPPGTRLVPGKNKKTVTVLCWNCDRWGHFRKDCPGPPQSGNGPARLPSDGRLGSHLLIPMGRCLTQLSLHRAPGVRGLTSPPMFNVLLSTLNGLNSVIPTAHTLASVWAWWRN